MKNPMNEQKRLFRLIMQVSELWEQFECFCEEKYQEMCEVNHNVNVGGVWLEYDTYMMETKFDGP